MKVIALIRTSTESQEVDSQRKELIEFILNDGVKADNIIVVGGAGASAIKVDEAYKRNMEEIYRLINDGGISTVYAWAIDRIGRNEEVLMNFKNRLIAANVQLVIKNPTLRLLQDDGTVNGGIELAFSLFATMAKQEMENKKARFKRAKTRNTEQGRYNGGRVHYGYTVDEEGRIKVDADEASVVKTLFELYASGNYSLSQLTKEMQERGTSIRGKMVRLHFVVNMLNSTAFIGFTEFNGVVRQYPRIISDDLFDKVREVMKRNTKGSGSRTTKVVHLAARLIVCPTCGRHWFASHRAYQCIGHKYHGQGLHDVDTCPNGESISIEWVDVAAWHVAKTLEWDYIVNLSEEKVNEAKAQIEVNNQKIANFTKLIESNEGKKKRIATLYVDGVLSDSEYKAKLAANKQEVADLERQIIELKELNGKLEELISTKSNEGVIFHVGGIYENAEEAYRIVHKHIKQITVSNYEHEGKTMKLIVITTVLGKEVRFLYNAKCKVRWGMIKRMICKLSIYDEEMGDWVIVHANANNVPPCKQLGLGDIGDLRNKGGITIIR